MNLIGIEATKKSDLPKFAPLPKPESVVFLAPHKSEKRTTASLIMPLIDRLEQKGIKTKKIDVPETNSQLERYNKYEDAKKDLWVPWQFKSVFLSAEDVIVRARLILDSLKEGKNTYVFEIHGSGAISKSDEVGGLDWNQIDGSAVFARPFVETARAAYNLLASVQSMTERKHYTNILANKRGYWNIRIMLKLMKKMIKELEPAQAYVVEIPSKQVKKPKAEWMGDHYADNYFTQYTQAVKFSPAEIECISRGFFEGI